MWCNQEVWIYYYSNCYSGVNFCSLWTQQCLRSRIFLNVNQCLGQRIGFRIKNWKTKKFFLRGWKRSLATKLSVSNPRSTKQWREIWNLPQFMTIILMHWWFIETCRIKNRNRNSSEWRDSIWSIGKSQNDFIYWLV